MLVIAVAAFCPQTTRAQINPCNVNPCLDGCPNRQCNPVCGGDVCAGGCPQRCNILVCNETASCDPACGGNPCNLNCVCWDACSTTVCTPGCPQFDPCSTNCVDPDCTPGCPGGNLCNDGCVDQCNPIICPGNHCDAACNSAPQCDPLCGGNPCNGGCEHECNFFLCPQNLCRLNCRPLAACDPLCGGTPCAPNCPPTGCGCPSNRCFNLEIDYMVDNDHSHRPNQAELDAVIQMFACQGWTLNIQVSDAIPHYDVLQADDIDCFNIFTNIGTEATFGRLKQQYADHAFEPGWYYAIFAHGYETKDQNGVCRDVGSSGLANGHDLIVTMGSFTGQIGTAFDRAATLAHEFGHCLGLTHCGNMDPGDLLSGSCNTVGDFPPNVASIMSYAYQLAGVRSGMLCNNFTFDEAVFFKEIDYSHGRMCALNESALDEVFGTGMLGVDWDCGGTISGVVNHDLDQAPGGGGWCSANGGRQVLSDFDEWDYIESEFAATAAVGPRPSTPPTPCITAKEVQDLVTAGGCTQPTLTTEACENRDTVFLNPSGGGGASGKCTFPYQNVQAAHDAAADNSVLLFRAGTYPQSGPMLLTKPMKLFNQPTTTQSTSVITAP